MTETERLLLNALEQQQKEHERTVRQLKKEFEEALNTALEQSNSVAMESRKHFMKVQDDMTLFADTCGKLLALLNSIASAARNDTKS